LEEQFGQTLLPDDPAENAIARQWIEETETSGFLTISYKFLRDDGSNPDATKHLEAELDAHLERLEQALGQYPGSYFLGQFSLVDILYSPHLDRLAANLPVYRGYSIKGNPRLPRINTWFEALSQRPAYHRVKSDSITNNLLLHRRWGIEPIGNLLPLDPAISQATAYRAEAAERLSDNHEAAIGDILKNSGVQALASNGDGAQIRETVEWHLRLLAEYLLKGDRLRLPWGRIGGKDNADLLAAAVGAITLAYIRNRICAPRDMSAGAATALRAAASHVLTSVF
jgi:glutathione S-transferase